ncbi:unnamed protein product, partial [Lampetra planeri]
MASEPPPPYQEPYPVGPSVPTAPSATPTPKGPPGMTGPLLGDTKSMPQPGQDGQFPVQTQPSWFPALPPYSATPPTMGPPQQGYPTSPGEYGPAFYPPQPVCPYPAYGQPLAAGGARRSRGPHDGRAVGGGPGGDAAAQRGAPAVPDAHGVPALPAAGHDADLSRLGHNERAHVRPLLHRRVRPGLLPHPVPRRRPQGRGAHLPQLQGAPLHVQAAV